MKNLLLLTSIVIFTSCGTIMGVREVVTVDTNVEGADLYVNGVNQGSAPGQIQLKPKDVVTLKKDGYRDQFVPIYTKFNAAVIGNLIFGGIPGLIVDAVTGSLKKIDGTYFKANMQESSK